MPTERNKGRAEELFNQLKGEHAVPDWIGIFASCIAFLLNRYINGD